MRREVDVPLAGARAERGDGEPKGHLWFRGECGDSVKVAVPVELAAAVALHGARVRLVVNVDDGTDIEWPQPGTKAVEQNKATVSAVDRLCAMAVGAPAPPAESSKKVAGPWEQSTGGRWVRRVDYRVVAEVSPRGFGRHEVDWSAQDGSGMSRCFAGTALAVQQAQDAADEFLRADGWVLR